ncbi:MAG TPA: carboxypeptidase-like regulatory domain-containing protein, partial [Phycisphaerae bacterium]|nr:carboxypeptidase-like regulatory domain-containing protein [Phycisphaerae bacterium]
GGGESSGLPGVPAGIGELRPVATNVASGFGPPSAVRLDVVSSGSGNKGRAGTLFGKPEGVGLVDSSPSKAAGIGPGAGSGTGNAAIDFGLPTDTAPPAPKMVEAPVLSEAIGRIVGTVSDAKSGEPLMGARVQLNVPGEISLEATTDEAGHFAMGVSEMPEHFAMSASMAGHLPKSRTGQRRNLRGRTMRMDFALEREQANVVPLEEDPVIHHLGNDRYEGSVNSQFQREAEGDKFFATFDLRTDQAPPNCTGAAIEMLAKGVQCPHKIRINGHLLPARLVDSPTDGSFGTQRVEIDASLLREGVNTFELKAISCNGDLDDFEFINLQLTLTRPEMHPH